MKWLWLIVRFVFGLIYRLIVLALFEKWIPFKKAEQEEQPVASRKQQKKKKKKQKTAQSAPQPRKQHQPARGYREEAFFDAESIEPSPALASRMEGQHMQLPRRRPPPPRPARKEQSLRAMLHDKRAIRDAMIVGSAFTPPQRK